MRTWFDVQAVASNTHPAFAWHALARCCVGCLSGGGEPRELAVRAPCYAGRGRLTHFIEYTGGRPLSFGARPWFDVRAVTSSAQPAFAWHFNRRHCAGCLSGGGETRELAARARLAALAVVGSRNKEIRCTGGRRLTLGARPWCDVRAVTSRTQPAFASPMHERHCTGYISGGGGTRELAAHARRTALIVICLPITEWHCTGGRPLSLGARPWFDVRAVASNTQPASRDRRTSATTLAVYWEVAKHASLLCARVVLRWL